MRAICFWATALLALGCSTSGPNGTSSGGATAAEASSNGGATGGGSTSGTSTGGGTSAGATGGSTTSGGSAGTTTTTGGATICGILDAGMIGVCNMAFTPDNLTVNIGDTIEVRIYEGNIHTVTSTDVPGDFDNIAKKAVGGWVFDTGKLGEYVSDAGKITILVPVDAGIMHGAVQPFFCTEHKAMMVGNPNPTITVR